MRINVSLDTQLVTLPVPLRIKAGSQAAIQIGFLRDSAAVTLDDGAQIEIAFKAKTGGGIVVFGDGFAVASGPAYEAIVDFNDPRLLGLLADRPQVDLVGEILWVIGNRRYRAANFALVAEAPVITGPAASESGPVWLRESETDARYAAKAANLGDIPDPAAARTNLGITATKRVQVSSRFDLSPAQTNVGDIVHQTGTSLPRVAVISIDGDVPDDPGENYLALYDDLGNVAQVDFGLGGMTASDSASALASAINAFFLAATATVEGNIVTVTATTVGAIQGAWYAEANLTPVTMTVTQEGFDGLPQGEFIVVDTAHLGDDAGFEAIGKTVQFLSGHGAPPMTLGGEGNGYVDIDTGDFFHRDLNGWQFVTNLKGPPGPITDHLNTGTSAIQGFAKLGINGGAYAMQSTTGRVVFFGQYQANDAGILKLPSGMSNGAQLLVKATEFPWSSPPYVSSYSTILQNEDGTASLARLEPHEAVLCTRYMGESYATGKWDVIMLPEFPYMARRCRASGVSLKTVGTTNLFRPVTGQNWITTGIVIWITSSTAGGGTTGNVSVQLEESGAGAIIVPATTLTLSSMQTGCSTRIAAASAAKICAANNYVRFRVNSCDTVTTLNATLFIEGFHAI